MAPTSEDSCEERNSVMDVSKILSTPPTKSQYLISSSYV